MEDHFDYNSAVRQIAEYERRRPKKYLNCGWRYRGVGYYRGSRYGKLLPETGYLYYTTQAWRVLQKCWLGYKIAKAQDDEQKMRYYAEGIRKAQKELGLEIESFPNLGLYGTDDSTNIEAPYDYECPSQQRWRERMEYYYYH